MTKIFVMNIKTLDTESTAVLLSVGLVWTELKAQFTIKELYQQSRFVKFSAAEQRSKYNRTMSKDTMDWWATQTKESQGVSLIPSKDDVSVETGIEILRDFYKANGGTKSDYVYSRGTLDSTVVASLCKRADIPQLFHYGQTRDVRTFIDVMYPNAKNGNVSVDKSICIDYNESTIILHNPVDDCVKDISMMMGGTV